MVESVGVLVPLLAGLALPMQRVAEGGSEDAGGMAIRPMPVMAVRPARILPMTVWGMASL